VEGERKDLVAHASLLVLDFSMLLFVLYA